MDSGVLCKTILFFFIYSCMGWICECIYCSIPARKFINRGFLTGPLCPVYGFGALLVIWMLTPVSGDVGMLFIFGLLVTSALEYITSLLLEKLFHMKWWDYSTKHCNIHGARLLIELRSVWHIICFAYERNSPTHPAIGKYLFSGCFVYCHIYIMQYFTVGFDCFRTRHLAAQWKTQTTA